MQTEADETEGKRVHQSAASLAQEQRADQREIFSAHFCNICSCFFTSLLSPISTGPKAFYKCWSPCVTAPRLLISLQQVIHTKDCVRTWQGCAVHVTGPRLWLLGLALLSCFVLFCLVFKCASHNFADISCWNEVRVLCFCFLFLYWLQLTTFLRQPR